MRVKRGQGHTYVVGPTMPSEYFGSSGEAYDLVGATILPFSFLYECMYLPSTIIERTSVEYANTERE